MNISKPNDVQTKKLLKTFKVHLLEQNLLLAHEGHLPNIACFLWRGTGQCYVIDQDGQEKQIDRHLGDGTLIGLYNIIFDLKTNYTVEINAGSQICLIDRSSLEDSYEAITDMRIKA